MIETYLDQVSTYAADIDNLITLVTVLVGVWFLAAEGIFFWFIWKFRAKDGVRAEYIDGTHPKHTRFISVPHMLVLVCDVVIIFFAVRVWVDVKQTMPAPDETVRIMTQQRSWSFVQPGRDGKLDTADDIHTGGVLNVAEGKTYHFELQSKDVLHSFSVPVFRLKQDAIPGRTVIGWFKAKKTGEFDIQCAEMCGIGHGIMGARIAIRSAEDHLKWVEAHSPAPAVAALPAAPVEAPPADATAADAAAADPTTDPSAATPAAEPATTGGTP
jgi:cytochrome c oxidase subunit 2